MAIGSWSLVRVYGTWVDAKGVLLPGKWKVRVPTRLTNSSDDYIIPAGLFDQGDLNVTPGVPSLSLLCPSTDDPDIQQSGWKLEVEISFTGGQAGEKYVIDVPIANRPISDGGDGLGINLRTIALTAQLPPQVGMYGVGRPSGLALLSADGAAVLDADGNPIASGGAADWDELAGKPTVIAAGASESAARSAISAASTASLVGKADLDVGTGKLNSSQLPSVPAAAVSATTAVQSLLTATDAAGARVGIGAVGKGELLLNVMDYGAKGDSNTTGSTGTDDLAAIHAAAAAAGGSSALGTTVWFPKVANGYRAVGTVELPGTINVRMDSPVITPASVTGVGLRYNGTGGVSAGRDLVLRQKRGVVTDWSSEADIGILTRNVQRSRITIEEVRNNTIGYQRLGDAGGHVYNEITLLLIDSHKVGVDCETIGSGWVNEENIYGGNFTVGSTVNTSLSRIGVRIRSSVGYRCNAQVYHKPSFEIAVGITGGAEAIPILIADGINNRFYDVRNEGTSLLIRTTGLANNNRASVTYGSGAAAGDSIDDQGSFPTTVVERSRYQHMEAFARQVWAMTDIHKRAFPYDGTATNVPGMVMLGASGTTISRALSGFTINANYLETASRHIGVQIKTTVVKRFVVAADCETGYGGRVHVRCYDSAGTIMDPASYTSNPLVRGASGSTLSASSGMGYASGSDENTPTFFSVAPSVASIVVCMTSGTAALRIRAMRVSAVAPDVPAAGTPFPENLVDPIATAAPASGTYEQGRRVYNATPATGQPIGWVCTVAGSPGTWKAFGTIS